MVNEIRTRTNFVRVRNYVNVLRMRQKEAKSGNDDVGVNIVKAKTCVCCGVLGHAIDTCPVRLLLTETFSNDPITKSLFGTIKGLQAGYPRGADGAEQAIANRLG